MSWEKMVPSCFGENDVLFAIHPLDEGRAMEMISAAKAAGSSFDDLEKEMVWHVYKRVTAEGLLQEHLARQINRAKDLW